MSRWIDFIAICCLFAAPTLAKEKPPPVYKEGQVVFEHLWRAGDETIVKTFTVQGRFTVLQGKCDAPFKEDPRFLSLQGVEGTIRYDRVYSHSRPCDPESFYGDKEALAECRRTTVKREVEVAERPHVSAPGKGLMVGKHGTVMGCATLEPAKKRSEFTRPRFNVANDNAHPEDRRGTRTYVGGKEEALTFPSYESLYFGQREFSGTYDPEAPEIVGNWRDEELAREDAEQHGEDGHEHHEFKITWRLGAEKPKGELRLAPVSEETHRRWLPLGEKDPNQKPFLVRAWFEEKSGKPKKSDRIRLALSDVTNYPGEATNWPAEKEANTKPDLYFPRSEHNLKHFTFDGEGAVTTKEEVGEIAVEIASRDYAAYGRITAAGVKQGERASTPGGASFLTLPLDENGNKIADDWERELGLFGRNPGALVDHDRLPLEQRRSGDGLTLFEEYRGFVTDENVPGKKDEWAAKQPKSGHVRTNPSHKDVFLKDETGSFKSFYGKPNPAELTWHLVSGDQMLTVWPTLSKGADGEWATQEVPHNRVINFNSPKELRIAHQKGLHLVLRSTKYPVLDFLTAGRVIGGAEMHLRDTHLVIVWDKPTFVNNLVNTVNGNPTVSRKYSTDQITQIAVNQYENTVIHEMGHGLGIRHHCKGPRRWPPSDGPGTPKPKEGTPPPRVYSNLTCAHERDVPEGSTNSFQSFLAMGGVPSCAMTYTFQNEKEFITTRILNRQTTYCRKGDQYIDDFMQKQPADDCFGQVDVSVVKP